VSNVSAHERKQFAEALALVAEGFGEKCHLTHDCDHLQHHLLVCCKVGASGLPCKRNQSNTQSDHEDKQGNDVAMITKNKCLSDKHQ
jgi:hypothetical protein